jgi:hypothetical protein
MNSIARYFLAMLACSAMATAALAGKPMQFQVASKPRQSQQVRQATYVPSYEEGPMDACQADEGWCDPCGPSEIWSSGFEFTFLKPRFEDNLAFSTVDSDGVSFEELSDTEFDYGLELSPRVWVQYDHGDGLGLRAQYWQFDHEADFESASPPANGFGRIATPQFADVDISTTIPTDTLSASSALNAYAIDLEGTKRVEFCNWWLGVSGGVRYASVDQMYKARLRDDDGDLEGEINFQHRIGGVGPTVSLFAARCYGYDFTLFGLVRGALLFGDAESRLEAAEDLDLEDPFVTRQKTSREDLLPVGEMQIGVDWSPQTCGQWQPLVSVALEGQLWSNAGNASSEDGDLGFFGFNVGVGAAH